MLPGAYKVFTTIVRRESVTLSALAEILTADKGQISRTVRELEQLGLIERTPDPEDGRSSLLSPTHEGLVRLAEARAPHERMLVDSLEEWSVATSATSPAFCTPSPRASPPRGRRSDFLCKVAPA